MLNPNLALDIKLPLDAGKEFMWRIARPQRLLRFFSQQSPALRRQLHALGSSLQNPAVIIHCVDDVTAGHLLAPSHGRSFTTYRFSFKEFGRLLTCSEMWLEYAILRTAVAEQVVGGHSYIMRVLMHVFFTSAESFSRVGTVNHY